jgi:Ca2+-binding RTX toxin-like protein
MVRLLVVLLMTAAGSVLPALAGPSADAGAAMCGGQVVTIDLNQPGAPDPDRDAADVVLGTPGDDRIETGGRADVVCAGAGDDVVRGGPGPDVLYGEGGNDLIDGSDGYDVLHGNTGADTLLGGSKGDQLYPDGGAPGGGRDRSYGGGDPDRLYSSVGDDLLVGGSGPDDVLYDDLGDAADGVTVDLMVAGRQDTGAGGVDELVSIQDLYGSAGDDVLSGNGGNNEISGQGGADILKGRDGNDHLAGGPGTTARGGRGRDWIYGAERAYAGPGDDQLPSSTADELLVGGPGSDTIRYLYGGCRDCPEDPGDVVITIDLARNGPQDTGGGGMDELVGIENVLTGAGDDVLSGNGEANRLESQWGDDILNGRAGADWLDGGQDHDTCNGGPGRDRIEDCE